MTTMALAKDKLVTNEPRDSFEVHFEMGYREGVRWALFTILRARFGFWDPSASQRIADGKTADLGRWTERALRATRIEDLFTE